MPAGIVDQTRVTLNGTPKFNGTVGLESDRVAVKLTKKISSEETPKPKAQPNGR
jgi:flagellar motor switch protein FliM